MDLMDNELSNQSNKSDEEEYQFSPEVESSSAAFAAATPTAAATANIFDKLKRKNIFIGLGVIVVIFIVYKLADVLFTTNAFHHAPSTAPTASSTPAITTQLPPIQASAPAQPQPSMAAAQPMSDVVNNRLSDIASRQADDQASLEKLNSQLSDMQSSLAALNNQVSSLSSAVQTLASQFAAQQAAAEAAKKAAQKKVAQQKAAPKPIYFVRSMIPGRAWLLTQNGETVTVSVGNNLPGYGTIVSIDPIQGAVTTSTGAIIGYSPGDS